MTGSRDVIRAGHQAATVAATTASSATATRRGQGRSVRGMRWFAADSTAGAATIQPTTPSTVPMTAATAPVMAPVASMTSRTWRCVAPIATSMPSWRWRRWATTTKAAAASSPTSASASVVTARTTAAIAAWSTSLPMTSILNPMSSPVGPRSLEVSASTVNASGAARVPGATSAKSSLRFAGFSTRPTTVARSPSIVTAA